MPPTLVVTNDFPPRIGGIESFVADVCTLLDDDVVVYTSGPPGAELTDRSRGYPVVRDGSLLLPTRRVREQAVELLTAYGCRQVVFGAAAPLGLLAPALRRAGAEIIIGLTHGHEVWWATLPGTRTLLRRIGETTDHLTTVSDYTTDRIAPAMSPAAAGRLRRLAPPVDTGVFRPGPAEQDQPRRCIAVGRFVPQKGFATLLRAWRRVLDRWNGPGRPELVLVGGGPQPADQERLVVELRMTGTVELAGAQARPEVVRRLQQADVFALPVRTRLRGLNPEGLGLAALEAAACGLPVVVGRSGGAPETVVDGVTGFVVDPDDHEGLADHISTLLTDRPLARSMGARGRDRVVAQFGPAAARSTLRSLLRLG